MRVYGRPRRAARRRRWVLVAALVLTAALAALGGHALAQRGHVASGVRVGGIDVGGRDLAGARAAIARYYGERLRRPVVVRSGDLSARVVPATLGIRVDAAASARLALRQGGLGDALLPFGGGARVAPVVRLPARFATPPALLPATSPAVDATFWLGPRGATRITPSRDGIGFDGRDALRRVAAAALAAGGAVELTPRPQAAALTTGAVRRAQSTVRHILSRPLVILRPGVTRGSLGAAQLAPLLVAHVYPHAVGIGFDPAGVGRLLSALLRRHLRPARDASWHETGGGAVAVAGALTGIAVNGELTARRMTHAARGPAATPVARVAYRLTRPTFTTAQARALHVTRVVSTFTSDMGVSSANRIFNVHKMAGILDGTVVRPGETFSFNQVVGPRTAQRGFLEGQAIENGLLVPSIGGGVCQVATTVFNAAFLGGYPIVERHNHSFYISHYPLGLDATVADGGPDFQFRNDTSHPLVIHTSYTDQTLTVSFYSAPLGRTVQATTGPQTGFANPGSRYIADPAAAPKQLVQQTSGEQGFDVTVTRRIVDGQGRTLSVDSFASHYVPEDVIFSVGKGAKVPKGAVLEPAQTVPAG
jgi:vancomycin resistance protein YoaR